MDGTKTIWHGFYLLYDVQNEEGSGLKKKYVQISKPAEGVNNASSSVPLSLMPKVFRSGLSQITSQTIHRNFDKCCWLRDKYGEVDSS